MTTGTAGTASTSAERRLEIARKKERLEELRRAKEQRQAAATQTPHIPTTLFASSRKDVDELVESLIGPVGAVRSTVGAAREQIGAAQGSLRSHAAAEAGVLPQSQGAQGIDGGVDAVATIADAANATATAATTAVSGDGDTSKTEPTLTTSDTYVFEIVPEEKVMYTKEVQTDDLASVAWEMPPAEPAPPMLSRKKSEFGLTRRASDAEMRIVREVSLREATLQSSILEEVEEVEAKVAELSEQERSTLLASETFIDFFDRSTKVIERALTEDYDILVDYTATVEEDETKEANEIKRIRAFSSDKHTKNRALTDVDWSMQYPELVLGSYNKNAANINEPDGLVIVWNLHMSDRPEFVLQSQSDVMSAKFSPFHHHMVVGGTYSGQIVIWDVRAKNTPILKTSLSSPGHSHPVYSLAIIGTQNAHNLVSASTDGVVCTWQLDMIAQPQDVLELTHASNPRTDEVAVSCMAFHHNETSTFWVGTEEGNVYQANRFDSASSKAGIDPQAVYAGHNGMVTGIDFHSGAGSLDFQDLFLTSSVDWTVKLWKTQPAAKTAGMHAGGPVATCLHSFDEAEDYVFDVAWSPVHPAMFASVDGTGRFDLYNLAISEIPVASDTMPNRKALNKIAWDKEGRRVGLASSDGSLFVYDIGQLHQSRSEDSMRFGAVLKEFSSGFD